MKEKDTRVPQTDNQRDPYRALPEDFKITRNVGDGEDEIFHGQASDAIHKESDRYCYRRFTGTATRATSADDAGPSHTSRADGFDRD